jgi:hypothetical protein
MPKETGIFQDIAATLFNVFLEKLEILKTIESFVNRLNHFYKILP